MEASHSPIHRKDRPVKLVWPSLVLAGMFWLLLGLLVIFVDPTRVADFGIQGSYLLFFGLVWLAIFYSMAILTHSSRRGILAAGGICLFLFFRLKGIGTILNFILLFGLIFAFDRYLRTRG